MNKHMYIILHYITNFFGNLGYLLEKDKIEIYAYVVWITMYRYISMFPLLMKENKRNLEIQRTGTSYLCSLWDYWTIDQIQLIHAHFIFRPKTIYRVCRLTRYMSFEQINVTTSSMKELDYFKQTTSALHYWSIKEKFQVP